MTTPNPREYAYIQVDRPISDGRRFLTQAREVGRRILGDDTQHATSLARYGFDVSDEWQDELHEPIHDISPIADPLLEVCAPNDLTMVVVSRGVPGHLASRFAIGRTMSQLGAKTVTRYDTIRDPETGERRRASRKFAGLSQQFEDISLTHSVDPVHTRVSCTVGVVGERGRDHVVGLFPDPSKVPYRVLSEQSRAVTIRLERDSPRIAYPSDLSQIVAPFARFPGDVTDVQYTRIIEGLCRLAPVMVTMGSPIVRSVSKP
ncbi:MAG TPA: hypothetical protein VF575_02865 [Candidatus Saccharimonadales bacterium]|jgi:hypothetical protein